MSESKKPKLAVYRVVDKRGGHHSITASQMMSTGDTVMFFDDESREQVGSFAGPIGVMLDASAQSSMFADLVQGEAVFEPSDRGAVRGWALVVAVAALFGLKVFELFWFGG